MRAIAIPVVFFCSFLCAPAGAQIDLDSGFGVDGLVAFQGRGPTDEGITDMQIDASDRISFVYAGTGTRGVGRYLADGSLDASFGVEGVVALDLFPRALVITPDGSIVVGGVRNNRWRLVRLLANGSLDGNFGDDGALAIDWFDDNDEIHALAVTDSGNVAVAGRAFDPAQGSGLALAVIDSAGSIVAQRFAKVFAGNADWCTDVLIQSNGRLVCVGLTRNFGGARMVAARFLPNLDFDTTFGDNGLAVVDINANDMESRAGTLNGSGQIVMGGWVDRGVDGLNLAIVRLGSDGTVDTSFGSDGLVETEIVGGSSSEFVTDLMMDGNDLLAAVLSEQLGDFAVLRFDANGAPVTTFGDSGLAQVDFNGLVDNPAVLAMHQGNFLVGGLATSALRSEAGNLGLVRLLASGDPDPAFANAGVLETGLSGPLRTQVADAVRRSDGGMIAAVSLGATFSARDFSLIGIRSDGTIDVDFGDGGAASADFANNEDTAEAVAIQPDGRIVVVGGVRQSTQGTDFGIARFMPDGSLDAGFGTDGRVSVDLDGATDTARAIAVLPDGKILAAGEGQFFNSGGDGDLVVIRLLANGTLDTSFGTDGIARADSGASFEFGNALAVLDDGTIIIGGSASQDFVLAAFDADGVVDTGFGTNGIAALDFSGNFDGISTLLVVPNWNGQGERVIAVGMSRTGSSTSTSDFAVAMFKRDGTLETGFGNAGKTSLDLSGGGRDEASDVVLWQERLVLIGRSGDGASQNGADFALVGLDLNGVPDPDFTTSGPSLKFDFFGADDDARAVAVDGSSLTLLGTVFDPVLGSQLAGLGRLKDPELIFNDGFEGL